MKLAGIIYYSILKAAEKNFPIGKTMLQKIIFFSLTGTHREMLYVPFHYGPFCFSVQSVCESMVTNKYLEYHASNSVFCIKKIIKEDDINIDREIATRCTKTLQFLDKNEIVNTKDIAFLSKIYYFLINNPGNVDDFNKFAREKSTIYGWFEVVKASEKRFAEYLTYAGELRVVLGEN
ncbi:MAG: hypothetical protein RDU30_11275 [Desulfovibrionaceae bacterium]|nr:hypothetical protein [Desulfovibrionaceae bacterium]